MDSQLAKRLAQRLGFDSRVVDLVHRDFTVVCISVALFLFVAERAFTEYKRRRNETAKINLRKAS